MAFRFTIGAFTRLRTVAAVLAITYLISGCASSSNLFGSEKLGDDDFSKYKTYAFSPTTDTSYTRMINKKEFEQNLGASVIAQLNRLGMRRDTANPDCIFTYKLILNRKYTVNQSQEVVYSPQYYNGFYQDQQIVVFSSDNRPAVYNGKMNVDTLREGSIVIDMIDPKQNKVVWRAHGAGERKETYRQPPKELIDEIVKELFKKYPRK